MRVELLNEVGSTNDYIRRYLDGGEDFAVCALRQTSGRGTKGRSFLSEEGGVYLSALRFFPCLNARDAFFIMQHAAVSVCRTVEDFGARPCIKWPNDVLVGGKKIAGILIENACSHGQIVNSIVGIGLNVRNDLGELSDIAINLCEATGRDLSVDNVRERLIENFCGTDFVQASGLYARRVLLGEVNVVTAGETYRAIAKSVLPDGRLEVERDGKTVALSSAEISVRLTEKGV